MSNQRYSPEFRDEAVRQIIEAGHSVTEVAARLASIQNARRMPATIAAPSTRMRDEGISRALFIVKV